jgi:hypothetical protein
LLLYGRIREPACQPVPNAALLVAGRLADGHARLAAQLTVWEAVATLQKHAFWRKCMWFSIRRVELDAGCF